MKIALIYYGNLPEQGGTGYVLDCLIRTFQKREDKIFFFNPYDSRENSFKITKLRKQNLQSIVRSLFKPRYLKLSLISIWKLLIDKKICSSDKIRMVLFLLIKPNITFITIKNISHILPIIKKLDIDLLLGGSTTAEVLPLILILSRLLNKKVSSFTYGNDFLVKSKFSLQANYIRNLDLILLGADYIKNLMRKVHHIDESKLKVIRYGLILKDYEIQESKESLRKKYEIGPNQFVILSVGRHVSRKNFNLVIEAIKLIKVKNPKFKISYYLIGRGEKTEALKNLTKKLDLEKYIKFLGFTDKKTRNEFYKLSDLFIMPSSVERESIEGFGIVYLEANYFHCPVIGTLSGGIREAIIDGKTGLLIRENDLNDLVEKIKDLYINKDYRDNLAHYGHDRVIKFFNWELLIDSYINAFKESVN